MPLPVIFATLAQGNESLALLDTQFNALGALVVIPCNSSGQNSILLTTASNTPTITSYTNASPVFTWFQQQTTTGQVTISVNGLAPLAAAGTNGGVLLGAGDLVANNLYQCQFSPNVNSFAGGFVVNAQTPVTSQGTWVPVLAGSSVAGTPVYTSQGGSYEQIGRQVTIRFSVAVSAVTGIAGNVQISGLPFPCGSDFGMVCFSEFSGWTEANYQVLGGRITPPNTFISLISSAQGVTGTFTPATSLTANMTLLGFGSYHV